MALDHLDKVIMREPINHVIDADIKGFFDNLSHEWLKKFLEVRIKDRSLLRIIVRFLKSGIMEDLKTYETEKGTPQGGVISPVLANLYLHYVLDLWVEKVIKRRYLGAVEIVRYADDFVICVRQKDEAIRLLDELKERFEMFGLELAEEKTRLIEFGRYAETNARKNGRSPDTFDFLGFTHYCSKSRNGRFMVKRKTARKKLCVKINETYQWLKDIRNQVKVREWWSIVAAKLRGHYQYYGVSGNFRCLKSFYWLVVRAVFKWLNRRSQKKSMNWNQFREYLVRFPLPKPRITYNMYTLCS
jgi:RNA-directed DNA polymerase